MNAQTEALVRGLAREFAGVVGGLTGGATTLTDTDASVEARWVVRIEVGGRGAGQLVLAMSDKDAVEITRRVMGLDEAPPEAAVADTMLEFGGQAAGSLSQDSVAAGLTLTACLGDVEALQPASSTRFRLLLEAEFHPILEVWGVVELLEAEVVTPRQEAATFSDATSFTSTVGVEHPRASVPEPRNLEVLMDVELPISVRFGRAEMSLLAVTRLGPGAVIDLGRSPDDPVELMVSGKVVARGEVVVVAGNYGVRITEVVSTTERIQSMGA